MSESELIVSADPIDIATLRDHEAVRRIIFDHGNVTEVAIVRGGRRCALPSGELAMHLRVIDGTVLELASVATVRFTNLDYIGPRAIDTFWNSFVSRQFLERALFAHVNEHGAKGSFAPMRDLRSGTDADHAGDSEEPRALLLRYRDNFVGVH